MERDSLLYKARRKMQILAHKILPDDILSKMYFKVVLGKKLDLVNPKTFNEKIQWCKLYYFPEDKLVVQCADKFAVREHVTNKGYEHILTPLLGSWNNAQEIPWSELPNSFVLKCNHGCAYNIICMDKKEIDIKKTERQLNEWMKEDFGAFNIELHYSKIQNKKIICEENLGEKLVDYKFFCFNGEPRYIYVSTDLVHDRQAQIGFFYLDGSKMPLTRDDYTDIPEVELPEFFEEMMNAAKVLASDFPFVRVDFFVAKNRFYFAELTFTPGAGMMPFNPDRFDLEWGEQLDISEKMRYSKK